MIDLIWEQGEDIVRNNERTVKYRVFEDGMLYIKEFSNERNKVEKIIHLNKTEAKKINDEIRLIRFTPKQESKLPFDVKGILFENEKQIKGLSLTLSKFIG